MTPLRRTASQARTRQLLVDAATDMIAADGVESLVLGDVAARAGFSRGAFHSNFADKGELVAAVQREAIDVAIGFMDRAEETAGSSVQRLATYVDANLEFCGAHPQHALALVKIAVQLAWSATAEFARERQRADPRLEALLAEGQSKGEMREFDTAVMARLVRNAIDSMAGDAAVASESERKLLSAEIATTFERATGEGAAVGDPLAVAIDVISRADGIKRAIDSRLVLRGIGTDDFLLLRAIDGATGGRVKRSDLAAALHMKAAEIIRRIVPLEKLGWVSRSTDDDGHASLAVTESGHDLVDHCSDLAADAVTKQ